MNNEFVFALSVNFSKLRLVIDSRRSTKCVRFLIWMLFWRLSKAVCRTCFSTASMLYLEIWSRENKWRTKIKKILITSAQEDSISYFSPTRGKFSKISLSASPWAAHFWIAYSSPSQRLRFTEKKVNLIWDSSRRSQRSSRTLILK